MRELRTLILLILVSGLLLIANSCKDEPEPLTAEIEFSLGGLIESTSSSANLDDGDPVPSSILVTILDSDGDEVYNRESIKILRFGDSFVSEKINLLEGSFSLSEFFVLDADGKTVYAAPKEGSAFAQLVSDPLNIEFNAVDKTVTEVQVEVLKAELADPDKFGYGSFELNIIGTIDVQVAVSVYDEATQQLQLTTADLLITDNDGNDVNISLGDSTNVVRVRDSLANYYVTISKESYDSFLDTLTFSEISNYEVGKSALKATLLKDSDRDGVPDNIDQCDNTPEGREVDEVGCANPVYLGQNGVTIKAREWAEVGDQGIINGVTYTVVDETTLRQMVTDGDDVTKVATTMVSDMSRLFSSNPSFNQSINNWDVSNVTNMREMFRRSSFNRNIESWEVSNVTDMHYMFGQTDFNQSISGWNVSKVRDMSWMFSSTPFNQDISKWNVSSVENMSYMFQGDASLQHFNGNINDWNVGSVKNMEGLFQNTDYNQPLSNWDVSSVTNMSRMFNSSGTNGGYNQDISNWDVSSVENMSLMFYASPIDQNLSNWNVSSVANMSQMFSEAKSFNQDLSTWDVTSVTQCSDFSQGASNWTLPKPNFTNCN